MHIRYGYYKRWLSYVFSRAQSDKLSNFNWFQHTNDGPPAPPTKNSTNNKKSPHKISILLCAFVHTLDCLEKKLWVQNYWV